MQRLGGTVVSLTKDSSSVMKGESLEGREGEREGGREREREGGGRGMMMNARAIMLHVHEGEKNFLSLIVYLFSMQTQFE